MLTERELRLALYCAHEELRARRGEQRTRRPPMAWNAELVRALELELAVSSTRQSGRGESACSEDEQEWITTADAAARIGWSIRTVQRRHADLEGRKIGRQYLFPSSAVREQAEALTDDRSIA